MLYAYSPVSLAHECLSMLYAYPPMSLLLSNICVVYLLTYVSLDHWCLSMLHAYQPMSFLLTNVCLLYAYLPRSLLLTNVCLCCMLTYLCPPCSIMFVYVVCLLTYVSLAHWCLSMLHAYPYVHCLDRDPEPPFFGNGTALPRCWKGKEVRGRCLLFWSSCLISSASIQLATSANVEYTL